VDTNPSAVSPRHREIVLLQLEMEPWRVNVRGYKAIFGSLGCTHSVMAGGMLPQWYVVFAHRPVPWCRLASASTQPALSASPATQWVLVPSRGEFHGASQLSSDGQTGSNPAVPAKPCRLNLVGTTSPSSDRRSAGLFPSSRQTGSQRGFRFSAHKRLALFSPPENRKPDFGTITTAKGLSIINYFDHSFPA
jgi:hypothetical protein